MTATLSKEDVVEIFYAVEFFDNPLTDKLGVDGEYLLDGTATFTPQEAQRVADAVKQKLDGLESGRYDEEPDEVRTEGSETYEWARYLENILINIGKDGANLIG